MEPAASPTTGIDDRNRTFLTLLSRHERRLSGYILALVPNWADADEIAQEVKIKLWEQFDRYDPAGDFGAWAIAIAHYEILSYRERRQRQNARFSAEFIELVSDEAAQLGGELDARQQALTNCLGKLRPDHVELLRLCYDGEHTIAHVAKTIGRSVRGTQQTVARLRLQLQKCIEQVLRQEEAG